MCFTRGSLVVSSRCVRGWKHWLVRPKNQCITILNGNVASIARIEGQNWRHGDIEDTLLNILMSRAAGGKNFSKMDVKRVYFGNWLRDYSQAVDVGTVKYVSAEAIRILLWVLGFMSFGYGTKEFEVTTERLGCYRPEEHIDNPKDVRLRILNVQGKMLISGSMPTTSMPASTTHGYEDQWMNVESSRSTRRQD